MNRKGCTGGSPQPLSRVSEELRNGDVSAHEIYQNQRNNENEGLRESAIPHPPHAHPEALWVERNGFFQDSQTRLSAK